MSANFIENEERRERDGGEHRPEGPKSVDLTTPKAEEALTSLASRFQGGPSFTAVTRVVCRGDVACVARALQA